jgi:hypothetical protein
METNSTESVTIRPKVFISYSHDSPEHAAMVRGLSASLARDGCECYVDAYKDTNEDWPTWMTRLLLTVNFVLCVTTETYERRFRDEESEDQGLGVGWEAGLIRRLLYAKKLHNDRIFPVVFSSSDRNHIPVELQGYDNFLLDGPAGYEALLRKVFGRPLYAQPAIGIAPTLTTTQTAPLFDRPGESVSSFVGGAIAADISRILKYAPEQLIGRDDELKLLNDAWTKVQTHQPKRPHILTFVALGGEGKTSLVAKWAVELAHQDWPGCDAAFAWSFYSQGTKDQTAANSDLFLKEAITFFGDEKDKEFAAGNAGAFEKGQRLARIVGQRRGLLILDGLEPLQYPSTATAFKPGELKDQGIAKLLKDLATANKGLCILTTRIEVPELQAFKGGAIIETSLKRLSRQHGVDLLKRLGVKGSDRRNIPLNNDGELVSEFEKLVEDVKGHALTLTLLGGFLKRAFQGDIRKRDRVKFEKVDEKIDGGHAFRTMAAYEQWLLRDGGDEGQREVAILRLMGLFDRPADAGCLAALRAETITGLTEPLSGLADEDWEYCLSGLDAANLLTVNREATGTLLTLDAHPHLREYFARQLRLKNAKAWRAAHRRLYEHLCATEEGDEPTLEDLQPLYQAVVHGCQAGMQKKTLQEVFFIRIRKGNSDYATRRLGAFGSELGAVACFFETPWKYPARALTKSDQGWVLAVSAFALRAMGRLTEALEPMHASLTSPIEFEDWTNAAISAANLSELEVMLGEVAQAVKDAEQSVIYADRTKTPRHRIGKRSTHADALHQAGFRAEAETRFREAEQMQAGFMPQFGLLYSLRGFRYCDLLLGTPERAAWQVTNSGAKRPSKESLANLITLDGISERTVKTLQFDIKENWLLDIALHHLTLGRAALYKAIVGSVEATPQDSHKNDAASVVEIARLELDAAVAGLRRAGQMDHLPHALLSRAWLRSYTSTRTGPESAQEDLDEAWEIAERGPMKLFMADIHLYRARLFFREATYPWESPAADLAAARKLIEQCGYWRRKEELEDAETALKDWGSK